MNAERWLNEKRGISCREFLLQLNEKELIQFVEEKTGEIFNNAKDAEEYWNEFAEGYIKEYNEETGKDWDL